MALTRPKAAQINFDLTNISDPVIRLNSDKTDANDTDVGFIFERGSTGDNAVIVWDESADQFVLGTTTATGASTGDLTISSGELRLDTLRIDQSGSGLRMTNVGAFDNDGSDNFRVFATNDLKIAANGESGTAITIDATNQDVTITNDLRVTAGQFYYGGTAVTSTATELNLLDGVTSNIQTQIDGISSGGDVVEDTTPQLGGDLDVNGQKITSASNGHIEITPNGTGNVGIGTTSPSTLLHLKSAGPAILTLEADSDNVTEADNARIELSQDGGIVTGHMGYATSTNGISIWNNYDDYVRFGTNDVERMRIDSSGNVGIGTSSPTGKLNVYSGASGVTIDGSADEIFLEQAGNSGLTIGTPNTSTASIFFADPESNSAGRIQYLHSTDNLLFGTAAAERMRIDSSGNVGIGTSSPSSTLELNVSSGNLELKLNGATATHGIRNQSDGSFGHFDYTNSRWLDLRNYASDYYTLFTAGVERMRIDSSGGLLVGTTTNSGALTIEADSSTTNNRALHLTITDDDPTATTYGSYIDYNVSGATATGGSTNHIALRVDTDSSATGGDTTDEHKVFGIYNSLDVTGDSDLVYGIYNDMRASHSADTISALYGTYNLLESDNSGGTVTTATADRNLMYVNGTGSTTTAFASYNYTRLQDPSTVTNAYGSYNEVQLDTNSTVSGVYGVRSIIDEDGGSSSNEYLFHGEYQGTPSASGTGYGLYITGETKNYISGDVGIGTSTPSTELQVVGTVTATLFDGTATSARYADLAENYVADEQYEPGTVLIFGGEKEVTQSRSPDNNKIAGVVSTAPGVLMNKDCEGEFVVALAFTGRVPTKVKGTINKGDMMVSSNIEGVAVASDNPQIGTVIGKALENYDSEEVGVIEVVVGRL
jgi:hypothetical protein